MGAGLPPKPTVTSILVGAPNPGLLPKLPGAVGVVPQLGPGLYVAVGAPKLPAADCPTGAGG